MDSGACLEFGWQQVAGGFLALAGLVACSGGPPLQQTGDRSGAALRKVDVAEVSAAVYHGLPGHPLEEACGRWTWSKRQVEVFFGLSDVYPEAPYGRFYQVGCGVSGKLRAGGRDWTFSINGGGMATWQDGTTVRHFGCSAPECAPMLLLPSDGMEPD